MSVTLVTGGGRGFGRAFAVALAGPGKKVAVAARSQDELEETARLVRQAGAEARAILMDVTSPEAVRRGVAGIEQEWGAVDVLLNAAGVGRPYGPLWESGEDAWWQAFETNVRGPMLCCRAVLPGMIARGRGRIINVASGAGTFSIPYMSAYVTSKTALIRLTEVLAAEVEQFGVTVFAIQPGTVRTAMVDDVLGSEDGRRWLPWLCRIFDEGRGDSMAPGTALVRRLVSGEFDELSGRMFLAESTPEDLAGHGVEIRDKGLHVLRMRFHDRHRP